MSSSEPSFRPGWGHSKSPKNDELQAALDLGPDYDDGQGGEMLREMYSAYRVDIREGTRKKKTIVSVMINRSFPISGQVRVMFLGALLAAVIVLGLHFGDSCDLRCLNQTVLISIQKWRAVPNKSVNRWTLRISLNLRHRDARRAS